MKNKKIIIGSRGSKLALIYAERARAELLKNSEIESIEIKSITRNNVRLGISAPEEYTILRDELKRHDQIEEQEKSVETE